VSSSFDYLNIQHYGSSYNWFAGFHHDKADPTKEYFFLTNRKTDQSAIAKLLITNNTGFANFRVKNIKQHCLT
jgi:hypothetical protein